MKLNLKCRQDIRNGYTNIDSFALTGQALGDYQQGDISSLNWIVEDNSVDEILAIDALGYLSNKQIKTSISNWIQKLKPKGIFKIMVPDCYAVAKAFVQGQISLHDYAQSILGSQENGDNRLSAIDTLNLVDIIQGLGCRIVLKRYDGISIYIEATK